MDETTGINGIHHITAVTSSAADNLAFYESVMGLRLVKQTVNFDDPYTYHLYYGEGEGAPGTILTFFPWERLPQGRPGAGMVTAVAFAVAPDALGHWRARLTTRGIAITERRRFGDPVLAFTDPHGLHLEMVGTDEAGDAAASPGITGFHSATAVVNDGAATRRLLEDILGMAPMGREGHRYRFQMGAHGQPGRYYDVVVDPAAPAARPGAGTVHHIAFRTDDDAGQARWQRRLEKAGVAATGVRDRKYFRSIYFNAPQGVLFEIATDPPGFAVDETPDALGAGLQLPEQYEPLRRDIERRLPPLRGDHIRHVFLPGTRSSTSGRTLVPLHGTGGDESDLIPLARRLDPSAALISPRGQVLENGMPRFFRRLADGVFDTDDVIRRAADLAGFLRRAAIRYGRTADQLVALGYSNGANMAAAVMLNHPEVFSAAVLLRPMLPLRPVVMPDLSGRRVLMLSGTRDTVIPAESTDRLEALLTAAGARVERQALAAGHELTPMDAAIAAGWLADAASPETSPEECLADCAA